MPLFDYTCEVCGKRGREWRQDKPPRSCSRSCNSQLRAGKSFKPLKWPITAEIHELIKKVYQRDTGNGQVAALARRIGYPRWKITRYAIKMGFTAKQRKEPDWNEKEISILERNAHHSPEGIQKKLKAAGYERSVVGIVLKRKRLNLPSNLGGQSANSLAVCFGVDPHFITRAIKGGRLKAQMRGTSRQEIQGGDIYFIRDKSVREYILNHLNEIDIRKVDKYWFVDILTGN